MLSEVMRIVKKFNTAQQLTAMLTPSMVSMMSNNDQCFVCRCMGYFGHHCPNAQCYSCNEFGHFAQIAQRRFLHHEHHATKTGLVQGNDMPTPKRTDYTPPTIGTDMGDISNNHNYATIHTATGAAAVSEGTQ